MRGIKPPKVLCHASVDKMVVQLVMVLKAAAGKMQKIRKSSSSLLIVSVILRMSTVLQSDSYYMFSSDVFKSFKDQNILFHRTFCLENAGTSI